VKVNCVKWLRVDGSLILRILSHRSDKTPSLIAYNGYCGPSDEIMQCKSNPIELFLFFLPRSFGVHVATESNWYWEQTLDARVESAHADQVANSQARNRPTQSRERIRLKLQKFKKIRPHELLQWLGLLMVHMRSPKKHMADHWKLHERGVIPRGTFGSVMPRDRFKEISRFLHCADNSNSPAEKDRAWKIRPVL
jgi:hypothetical protein